MKISVAANSERCTKDFFVRGNGREVSVTDEKPVETDEFSDGERLDIYTKPSEKCSFPKAVGLFFARLAVNLFNIFILNYSPKWTEDSDLFSVRGSFTASENVEIRYSPAAVSKKSFAVSPPKMTASDRPVELSFSLDKNAVNRRFMRFCFDMFSFWLYACAVLAVIWFFSGNAAYWARVFVPVLAVVTVPAVVKALLENGVRKKLLNRFSAGKKPRDTEK